jgi:hypothetical protein
MGKFTKEMNCNEQIADFHVSMGIYLIREVFVGI